MSGPTRAQIIAFRVAGHGLHRRTTPQQAVAACPLQESPPGWAPVALHARADAVPAVLADGASTIFDAAGELDAVVVNAMRGAPYAVRLADVATFTRSLLPADDDAGLKALISGFTAKETIDAGLGLHEALDLVIEAARDGLAAGPLGRDAFHQALRERLPDALLPWCRGCQGHHVRPGFWRSLGAAGVTAMPAKATWALAGGPGAEALPPAPRDLDAAREGSEAAGTAFARWFLHAFGPAAPGELASWAQTSTAHAKALFAAIADDCETVTVDGKQRTILAADAERLAKPPQAEGVRLLGGYDPFTGQPDRATLCPDAAVRKQLSAPVARPGIVLVGGEVAGLWKGRKHKDTLAIEVQWLGRARADLQAEAGAVARLRGCTAATVDG